MRFPARPVVPGRASFLTAPGAVMRDAPYPLLPVLLSAALLLGACTLAGNDDGGESEDVEAYFRATLNGEEAWSGVPDAGLSQHGEYVLLSIFSDSVYHDYHRERLSLEVLFEGPGEYSLVPRTYEPYEGGILFSGAFFHESDWDALLAGYRATEDAPVNHLTITSYDSTTGILTGSFRATVVVNEDDRVDEPGEPPRRRPDTLRFTDGTFRVKVRDIRQ